MILIPAMDLIDGRCVRLTRGDYAARTHYDGTPEQVAAAFEAGGATHLHMVDLEGAKQGRITQLDVLERVAGRCGMEIDFSGGIAGESDITACLQAGASRVAVGSLAAKEPERFLEWVDRFGADRVVLSADARGGKIATRGWLDQSELEVGVFIGEHVSRGVRRVVCTDIDRDGLMQGPSAELYERLLGQVKKVELVASGGVSGMEDLERLARVRGPGGERLTGVIIGKALYEGAIRPEELGELGRRFRGTDEEERDASGPDGTGPDRGPVRGLATERPC